MKLYYADTVLIRERGEDGTYIAQSLNESVVYDKCVFLYINPACVQYDYIGKHALLISISNRNYIVGYYSTDDEIQKNGLYLEGEHLIMAGTGRAIVFGDDGAIGIYSISRKSDGSLHKVKKAEYNAKDEFSVSMNKLVMSMVGASAGGTIEMEKDEITGFYRYSFNGRGGDLDMGIRVKHEIQGTATGMTSEFVMDMTPSPTNPILTPPKLMDTVLPTSLSIKMSPLKPYEIAFNRGPVPNATMSIDMTGKITMDVGPAGIGAKIILDPIGPDTVTIEATSGLGKIVLNKAGMIDIEAALGVGIKGANTGLLATLIELVNYITTHTHPSAVGPTGPPTLPPTVPLTKLNLIKGGAE